ncbi:CAMK/CAMKL/AMPK protein kinase [Hysterangium stoloniferum]|nr:CAMK/CAMKL/AMPK protein kinase [Hysterangium stoloniferum]
MAETLQALGAKHRVTRLGEYKVIKDIAEGTFGKVKMAKHVITGQVVAMKFLSKEAINASGTKDRVLREVQYMKMLKHPHIVKLYEVISTPTHIIIVLEYVGGELFNYIVKNGQMTESRARRFFQQLMSGIDYSHRIKIVHRDLKPENVLLDDQLNVKIADFGLSNVVIDGEFLHTSCGSPNYAAPEVIHGLRYTGPEIDVWSCGVVLYVMLCGRLPFEDDDVNLLFAKISEGIYHQPSHLSPDARFLLSRMLTVDPVKRITVPEILKSSFYVVDLPRYLTPPSLPPVIGTLSSLVKPLKPIDFEYIEGLGRIDGDAVRRIADSMEGVTVDDVWNALRMDDGPQGNAVQVAYSLLRDKRRCEKGLGLWEEEERDAQLAALNPANGLPLLNSGNQNANESADDDETEGDNAGEDAANWEDPPPLKSHFAVLPSSLPNINHSHSSPSGRDKKPKKLKWHFGIRSRSPRMEVMLEIYRTLQSLGMEWKEKKFLGGLRASGTRTPADVEKLRIDRRSDLDGHTWEHFTNDPKVASSIFSVETRARTDDVVILMDLQLYQLEDDNYLVDFMHQGYYKASKDPCAMKFDRASTPESSCPSSRSSIRSVDKRCQSNGSEDVVSPFLFMDTACRLILELAGGGEGVPTSGTESTQVA